MSDEKVNRSQRWLKILLRARGVLPEGALDAGLRRQVARVRRRRGFRDQGKIRRADAVIVSHPKSGRTWLRTLLSRLFVERYGLPADEILEFDNLHRMNPAVPVLYFTDDNYVNDVSEDPGAKIDYRGKRIVLLVRNPLDVAVSLYHQHAKRTSRMKRSLNRIPDTVGEMPMFDYITRHPQGLRHVIEFLNGWERNLGAFDELLLVHYEDLHASTAETLGRITRFLGLDFSDEELFRAAEFASAKNLRKLGDQGHFKSHRLRPTVPGDPDSHKVRRAKVKGYRLDFTPEQVEEIEAHVREHLAPSLGYPDGGEVRTAATSGAAGV